MKYVIGLTYKFVSTSPLPNLGELRKYMYDIALKFYQFIPLVVLSSANNYVTMTWILHFTDPRLDNFNW